MFGRSSLFTLAFAALGATALISTSASAYVPGVPLKPVHKPVQFKPIHLPLKPGKPIIPVHPIIWPHHHHHDWWVQWHRPHYVVEPVVQTTAVSVPVVQKVEGPCTCLTKEYLPDGGILFKDLCTKEEAMATSDELKAQAQGAAPQIH